MDLTTGTIARSNSESVLNPLDLYAIEAALTITEKHGGTVRAVSMGPPAALNALKEAIAMGCDDAFLISDPKFGGSDTWATSYIIAQAIRRLDSYDLIICGERAIDGDTAQVGPGIAAWLDLPLATYVSEIELMNETRYQNDENILSVERLLEDGYQRLEIELPALLTVVKEIASPRLTTLEGTKRAKEYDVPIIGNSELDLDPSFIGLQGSPTRVVKIQTPKIVRSGKSVVIENRLTEAVSEIVSFLENRGFVENL